MLFFPDVYVVTVALPDWEESSQPSGKRNQVLPPSFRIPQSRRLLFRQRFEIIDRPERITFLLSPPEGISAGKASGDGS